MTTLLSPLRCLIVGGSLLILAGCSHPTQDIATLPKAPSSTPLESPPHAGVTDGSIKLPTSPLLKAALQLPTYPVIPAEELKHFTEEQNKANVWANFVSRSVAPPTNSGDGVVICEPIPQKASSAMTAFGSGCTRWLHLAVAGQGEMGKTPLWGAVDDARREMGKANLRLSQPEAAILGHKLGLTHVVTGIIAGQAQHCTLSLQVWKLPSLSPVGTRVVATGTPQSVLSQLPALARQLSNCFGARLTSVPAIAGVSPEDVEFLGRVPWGKADFAPDKQTERLEKLSDRLSVAGMIWVYSDAVDQDEEYRYRRVINNTVRQAPNNVMALAASGWQAPGYLGLHLNELNSLSHRYPNNYLLAVARRRWHSGNGDMEAQLRDAEAAVAAAPDNPMAWVALGSSFSDKADSIRNARFYDKMSATEQRAVAQLYPHNLAATLHATQLDPRSVTAWSALSEAAAFAGEPGIVDLALWKNIELAPNDRDAYNWGLQIYQPKWFSNQERLFKVVSLLASKPSVFFDETIPAQDALKEAGFSTEGQQILDLSVSQMQAEVKAHPRHVRVWEDLASVLDASGQYPQAVQAYKSWLALEPRNLIAINNLGTLYTNHLSDQKANLALMHQAMAIDPKDPRFPFNIGKYYKDYERNFDKAVPYFHQAMALDPNYAAPVTGLANLYWFLKNDEVMGGRLFKEAIQRDPRDGRTRAEYALALLRHGYKAQAMQQAQKSIALGETDYHVFAELGLQP